VRVDSAVAGIKTLPIVGNDRFNAGANRRAVQYALRAKFAFALVLV